MSHKKTIKLALNILSICFIVFGSLGMLYCLTYLWSTQIMDIIGAGLPFIAGAVLCGSGLITLAINNRQKS